MTRTVILGVDPGVHRLGLALADLVTGEPVRCGSAPIDVEDGGMIYQQIGRALSDFCVGTEPCLIAIEDPTHASRGKRQAAQWGTVFGLVEAEAHRRWPHAPSWRISPPGWKKAIGLAGNADRETYAHAAVMSGWDVPVCDDRVDYDAAAAAGVARWAWLTNQRQEAA